MPRYNVEADGEWACYTSISNGFITPFMPRKDYENWRKKEYGNNCNSLQSSNRMSLKEALYNLSLNKSDNEIISCLREAYLIDNPQKQEKSK
jgi:hypothetical protein